MFYSVLFYKSRVQRKSDISFVDICLGDLITKPNLSLLTQHTAKLICWHQVVAKESTLLMASIKQGAWAANTQKIWTL